MGKENYINDVDSIVEIWGEGFREIHNHPQIKFTNENIYVELKRTPALVSIESSEPTKVLKFDEPDIGILKSMDLAKGEISKAAILIQKCSNMPGASIDKIKGRDFIVISKVVGGFLSDSPEITGK